MTEQHQCSTCPWKVTSDTADIPNYSRQLHEGLTSTIAEPGTFDVGTLRMMACHHSTPGAEYVCAGWLFHQLGPGNNLTARLAVMHGQLPVPRVEGEQWQTFEETLDDQ